MASRPLYGWRWLLFRLAVWARGRPGSWSWSWRRRERWLTRYPSPLPAAFSILVEGHRRRAVPAVRGAQVSAVNAMMRFARNASNALPADEGDSGTDFETGEEADESEESTPK